MLGFLLKDLYFYLMYRVCRQDPSVRCSVSIQPPTPPNLPVPPVMARLVLVVSSKVALELEYFATPWMTI